MTSWPQPATLEWCFMNRVGPYDASAASGYAESAPGSDELKARDVTRA